MSFLRSFFSSFLGGFFLSLLLNGFFSFLLSQFALKGIGLISDYKIVILKGIDDSRLSLNLFLLRFLFLLFLCFLLSQFTFKGIRLTSVYKIVSSKEIVHRILNLSILFRRRLLLRCHFLRIVLFYLRIENSIGLSLFIHGSTFELCSDILHHRLDLVLRDLIVVTQLFSEQLIVLQHIVLGIIIKLMIGKRYGRIILEHHVCDSLRSYESFL